MQSDTFFDNLLDEISKYNPDFDEALIRSSYEYAKKVFWDKKRKYGDYYIDHAVKTAVNVVRLEINDVIIVSAILHDILEFKWGDNNSIKNQFWSEVYDIIRWVSKIPSIYTLSENENINSEQLKAFLFGALNDLRVVFIKIAEILTNLDSFHNLEEKKRIIISKEIIDIYVPVVELLWLWEFKWELENKCFKHIDNSSYDILYEKVWKKMEYYNKKIEDVKDMIIEEIEKYNITVSISWRVKSLYSIYKKMRSKNVSLANISDIIALRVTTDSQTNAYLVLWLIHSIYKAKFDRFKDYISLPKRNWYQAIHTTCFYLDGCFIEFQIQTSQMLQLNQYWLASYYFYKNNDSEFAEGSKRIKNIFEIQDQLSGWNLFLEKFKDEILNSNIVCYTLTWEWIDLPKKSTLLDFAYKISDNNWDYFDWAYINNEFTDNPIHILHNWDVIKLTKWKYKNINFRVDNITELKTNSAYEKIINLIKLWSVENKIKLWKFLLNKRLESIWFNQFEDFEYKLRFLVLNNYWLLNIEELYEKIWDRCLRSKDIVEFLSWTYYLNKSLKKISLKVYLKVMDFKTRLLLVELFCNLNTKLYSFLIKKNYYYLTFYVDDSNHLNHLLSEIDRVPNVRRARMTFPIRLIIFYIFLIIASIMIILSPILFFYLNDKAWIPNSFFINIPIIIAFVTMTFLLYLLKYISKITLNNVFNYKIFWIFLPVLNTIMLWIVLWESILIWSYINLTVFLWLSLVMYWLIAFEYIDFKSKNSEIRQNYAK